MAAAVYKSLHALLALTCVAWVVAVLATFWFGPWLWALAFGVFAVCVVLCLGFYAFVHERGVGWIALLASAALWIAVGLLASNALAEGRIKRERYWGGFVPEPMTGWYPEPNLAQHPLSVGESHFLATTDELGHRNGLPYPAERSLPVIIQGDSNAFGFGLDDDETLGVRLNALDPGGRYYNVGVPGFDVNQFYFQYQRLARTFDVGARVILFNARNDLTMSALSATYYIRRPYLTVTDGAIVEVVGNRSPLPVQGYGISFIEKYSRYDPLIADRTNAWAAIYPEPLLRVPLALQLIRTFHRTLGGVAQRLSSAERLELAAPPWLLLPPEDWPEPLRSFARDFELILARVAEQDPETTIFLFPFREQVVEAERTRLALSLPEAARPRIDPLAFGRWLGAVSVRAGIGFVDLTPVFLAAETPEALFQSDGHLTAAGIDLCAEQIVAARAPS